MEFAVFLLASDAKGNRGINLPSIIALAATIRYHHRRMKSAIMLRVDQNDQY